MGLLAALSVVSPAGAAGIATGQTLGVGDSRCTDRVQSDSGARLTGFFANGTGEWTALRSATVGGPETVVFRAPAGSPSGTQTPIDQTIAPTASGTFFYRACVSVDRIMKVSVFSVTHYQISLTSTGPNVVTDIGPETAALSLNAQACGDRTPVSSGDTIRLVGTGTGRTGWIISVTGSTNNYEGNWAVLYTATDGGIDQTFVLDPEITEVTACAGGGVTGSRDSVSFELSIIS
ncbi:hypothetical protein [Catellatospora sichuanensis]|uniref:hypothetical protein n=1 Tax=Catellatospora sichuanensis TaxID=1969805 RepID=UPI00118443A6|nr:hypothetical protein [Catellatospora sichuanensis]